jgi:hypothetical protein
MEIQETTMLGTLMGIQETTMLGKQVDSSSLQGIYNLQAHPLFFDIP